MSHESTPNSEQSATPSDVSANDIPISANDIPTAPEPRPAPAGQKDAPAAAKPQITLSPFYQSAVNSITEPDKYVFLSRYLVERWLPDLGPNAFAILCFLRRLCYHNRKTGELRNSRTVSMTEIAQGCKLSISTIRRELQNNAALQRFVVVRPEYAFDDQRGGFRKDRNSYTVAMDDPLHPLDEALLQARVREIAALREKAEQDPKERARQRAGAMRQNDASQSTPPVKMTHPPVNLEGGPLNLTHPPVNLTHPPSQNDATLSGDYSEIQKNILEIAQPTPAAPGVVASLSSEGSSEGGAASQEAGAFPEGERAYWEEEARGWFRANGVSEPSARSVRHTAEARWNKQRKER